MSSFGLAPGCPIPSCSNTCPDGVPWATDENDCQTCDCYVPEKECPMVDCVVSKKLVFLCSLCIIIFLPHEQITSNKIIDHVF